MSDSAATTSDKAFRVTEWAQLYGDDLAGKLRLDEQDDAETLAVIEDALQVAHEYLQERALRYFGGSA